MQHLAIVWRCNALGRYRDRPKQMLLLRVALDQGTSFDAACASLRIFGARQGPYRAAAQRCPTPLLRAALLQAARIDRMIKGLARGDLWDEFLQLVLRLSQRAAA